MVSPSAPRTDTTLSQLVEAVDALPGVDRAIVDNQWMSRLNQALLAAERWGLALGAAMVLGAILALANTLHLAIDARREEILVVRVIGGAPGFIRRPFLYTGCILVQRRGARRVMLWVLSLWMQARSTHYLSCTVSPGQIQAPALATPQR